MLVSIIKILTNIHNEGGGSILLQRLLLLRKPCKGGILIEFAFAIPVCIILLFFVHDHFRFYELKNKLKTSAYLIATMIQNINNSKSNEQLSLSDIKRIVFAGSLNLFHTNSMFYPFPLGTSPHAYFQYVKRIEENKYNYQAFWTNPYQKGSTSPATMRGAIDANGTRTLSQITNIHPDLECHKDGDERLLINYWFRQEFGSDESSSKIGFLIMKPKWGDVGFSINNKGSFSYVLIITPKPGLFPLRNN